MKRMLPMLVLLLAACGGGNEPAQAVPKGHDALYDELMAVCREADKALPGSSDWQSVIDEVTYENDGRDEMYALALDFAKTREPEETPETADEFIEMMNSSRQAKEAEAELTHEQIEAELQRTEEYAIRFGKLTRFDSLAVLVLRLDSSEERLLALGELLSEMLRRPRLLVIGEKIDQAARELTTYLEVLQRLDRNSSYRSRSLVNSDIRRILIELAQGWFQPLIGSESVSGALEPLFEHNDVGRKRAWLRELKYQVAFYLNTPKDDLIEYIRKTSRQRNEGLRRTLADVEYAVSLARTFDQHAPDLLSLEDVALAIEMARPFYHGVVVLFSDMVLVEADLQAAWLGYRLALENRREPLATRIEVVEEIARGYSFSAVRWHPTEVEIGVDPELQAAGVLSRSEFIPVVTIRLADTD